MVTTKAMKTVTLMWIGIMIVIPDFTNHHKVGCHLGHNISGGNKEILLFSWWDAIHFRHLAAIFNLQTHHSDNNGGTAILQSLIFVLNLIIIGSEVNSHPKFSSNSRFLVEDRFYNLVQ